MRDQSEDDGPIFFRTFLLFKQEANECDVKDSAFRWWLFSGHVAGHYVHFRTDRAKSLVPMERLICFPVARAQRFNPLHFLVIFFIAGKKLQQPGFEQFIRLERVKEKFPAPRA
jgi:hypothetical protein